MVFTDGIHLIAEDVSELHRFANSIGLERCWYQSGARHPHYKLLSGNNERNLKIFNRTKEMGAILIPTRTLVKISRRCYFFPETEEEVAEFERRNRWEISQPLTEKDQEDLDRMWHKIIKKISQRGSGKA